MQTWKRKTWPALKKSQAARTADRLHRRVRAERTPHTGSHLGAQGLDADHPVPLQLDAHLRHRRAVATNCLFRLHESSIKKEQHVEFLKALRAHLKQPLLIIWDGLKAHRSKLVREYLDSTDGSTRSRSSPKKFARTPDTPGRASSSVAIWPRRDARHRSTSASAMRSHRLRLTRSIQCCWMTCLRLACAPIPSTPSSRKSSTPSRFWA